MSNRTILRDADPEAFKVMMGFERYLSQSSLTKTHAELIKIRVSQINGCSYCIDKHITDAIAAGESHRRIHLLSVWRDTPFFSEEERAILALAEEMTHLSSHGVSDEVYENAAKLFDEKYLAEILLAIITINSWNRLAITTGMRAS